LPKNVIQMIKKLSEGKFTVEMEDTNIKKLTLEIDRSSNRISYGMIIAALLVASSLIIYIDKGPRYSDIPILALAGYLLAGMMSIVLVFSITREGKAQ